MITSPFLQCRRACGRDLDDFDSGRATFWHTPKDTMDKLDAHSFEIVGDVVMKSIEELEQQK